MTLPVQEQISPLKRSLFHASSSQSLFESMPEKKLTKGEVLFQGSSYHVYLVKRGMIKQSSWFQEKEILEDYYQAGELINCEVLFSQETKKYTNTALFNDTVVRKIPAHVFLEAVHANKRVRQEVMSNLLASLHRSREKVRCMSMLSAEQRVIHFLIRYAERSGRRVGYELVIKPFLTHQMIGQIAGTARQTVTTLLNGLRKEGVIHFNRRYLIVRDLDTLRSKLDYATHLF